MKIFIYIIVLTGYMIKKIIVGARKSRNFQAYEVQYEYELEGKELEYTEQEVDDLIVKRFQARARKKCNEQIVLDNASIRKN